MCSPAASGLLQSSSRGFLKIQKKRRLTLRLMRRLRRNMKTFLKNVDIHAMGLSEIAAIEKKGIKVAHNK